MIIIKVGGGISTNKAAIARDIKGLDETVVFVHGASKTRDVLAKKLNHPTKRITSPSGQVSVLTDKKALEILIMNYSLINKEWVSIFQKEEVNAIGLSGADGKIWEGVRKKYIVSKEGGREKLIKDTWTGKVTKVNSKVLKMLVGKDLLPVITQPAITSIGELINTDNDRNIAVMAKALDVEKLVVLFEAPGLLADFPNEKSLVKNVKKEDLDGYLDTARGTMKKKILGAKEAFQAGVKVIYWGDSRIDNPVNFALEGKGTIIR